MNAHSRCITQLILFTRKDLSQDPTHDLPRARLWQIIDDEDLFGSCERPNRLAYLKNQVFADLIIGFIAFFEGDESIDCLASQLVVDAHDSGFSYLI